MDRHAEVTSVKAVRAILHDTKCGVRLGQAEVSHCHSHCDDLWEPCHNITLGHAPQSKRRNTKQRTAGL